MLVHQLYAISVLRKGHGYTLRKPNANAVRQQPLHRRMLHPRQRLQLLLARANGDEEQVAANVLAKHSADILRRHLGIAVYLDLVRVGDAETRIGA